MRFYIFAKTYDNKDNKDVFRFKVKDRINEDPTDWESTVNLFKSEIPKWPRISDAFLVVDFGNNKEFNPLKFVSIDMDNSYIPFLVLAEYHITEGKIRLVNDKVHILRSGFIESFTNNLSAFERFYDNYINHKDVTLLCNNGNIKIVDSTLLTDKDCRMIKRFLIKPSSKENGVEL